MFSEENVSADYSAEVVSFLVCSQAQVEVPTPRVSEIQTPWDMV